MEAGAAAVATMAEPARYATLSGRPVQRIFISYRRADAEADANALCQSLEAAFGDAAIFRDVDNITVGLDFRQAIVSAIDDSAALVLVIGPQWLARHVRGRLRLCRESDQTMVEIERTRWRGADPPDPVRGAEMPGPTSSRWSWPGCRTSTRGRSSTTAGGVICSRS